MNTNVKTNKKIVYDVLVIGAGPAGMTAAIYAGRYELKTIVISQVFGGAASCAGQIENWPGFIGSGQELAEKFEESAKRFGAEFLQAKVIDIKKQKNLFKIKADDKKILGKTIIMAVGANYKKLGVKGEGEFIGKGVSYCGLCDGQFFKDKIVALIGGGNSAIKTALYLANIVKKIYLIHRNSKMRCEPILLKRLKQKKNIEISLNSILTEIKGNKTVKQIEIEQNNSKKILNVEGVFINIGSVPKDELIKDLNLKTNKKGYIITDKEAKTNILGIFAAGDITNHRLKQIVTSAGEGAVAAKSAYEYLTE